MWYSRRIAICGALVAGGLAGQVALEAACRSERPPMRRSLSRLPMTLGGWVGEERPVDPDLVARAQSTEYLSRVYENRKWPGLRFVLWANFSLMGTNLRHTPKICLPSGGWEEVEALYRVFGIPADEGPSVRISRLAYRQGELVNHVGFWYYIFGEGQLENYFRSLPITSQSSHGRATRGSSMTIEVFYPGDRDMNAEALRDFARELVRELEPILPTPRAAYYLP